MRREDIVPSARIKAIYGNLERVILKVKETYAITSRVDGSDVCNIDLSALEMFWELKERP